jgi:hypothetical protein
MPPLLCVTRVRNFALLADMPTENRLPVRVDFDVQGVGPWTRELSIYVPTAGQMDKWPNAGRWWRKCMAC